MAQWKGIIKVIRAGVIIFFTFSDPMNAVISNYLGLAN